MKTPHTMIGVAMAVGSAACGRGFGATRDVDGQEL
jgi:hypothetical protein